MTNMVVLVPTRGRPESALRLHNAVQETALGDTDVLFLVDEDDPKLIEYADTLREANAIMEVGPRLRMVGTLNAAAQRYHNSYGVTGFCGDDHLPRTPGWDTRIMDAVGPGGIVYGNDLFQGPNLPTAVFMDSAIIEMLGYMAPPAMKHLFVDNAWKAWGEGTSKLVYLDDVIIEHLHPQAGKAEWDAGHIEVNSSATYKADGDAWEAYSRTGLGQDLIKLHGLTQKWRPYL